MTDWACQSPDHEGERLVRFVQDRWVKRTTYMRADGALRRHETNVPDGRRCSRCMHREVAALKSNPGQGSLL